MHNAKGMFRLDRSKGVLKPATSDTKEIYPTRCIRMYILEGLILDHGIDQIFPLVPHLEPFFWERFLVAICQAAGEATRVAA